MVTSRYVSILRTILLILIVCHCSFPVYAQYSGGSGTADDPYQIATAEDLMLLGITYGDYDKHFIMTADIDLDPNLPGRKVFDTAVIVGSASDQGISFTGTFDGNGHEVSHLTVTGSRDLGLFGELESGGKILNLGVKDVNVNGSDFGVDGSDFGVDGSGVGVGGLVGFIRHGSSVINCYSTGKVRGYSRVGGLAGYNNGDVNHSYSYCSITGHSSVGGLVGYINAYGKIAASLSTGNVSGYEAIGGLVGRNYGSITMSYSAGEASGSKWIGGLVGVNGRTITSSYSAGAVTGTSWVGGLVGSAGNTRSRVSGCYSTGLVRGSESVGGLVGRASGNVASSFWDVETSELTSSAGGTGKTTVEMQTTGTFLDTGWDFVGETVNGADNVWKIVEGQTYPLLSWQKYGGGTGEPNNPYLIYTADHLNALGAEPNDYDRHFKLMADIDLSGYVYDRAVIASDANDYTPFTGIFDGNGHIILNLTVVGESRLGLFAYLDLGADVRNLGLVDVNIIGSGHLVGGLAAVNREGTVSNCYSNGAISGDEDVGGLVCSNDGSIVMSYSTGAVSSTGTATGWYSGYVGGLVCSNDGSILMSYSTSAVNGQGTTGGLVGVNYGDIGISFSAGTVSSNSTATCSPFRYGDGVGGLAGINGGDISNSYSMSAVNASCITGGFVGQNLPKGNIKSCFSKGKVTGERNVEIGNIGGFVGGNYDCGIQMDYGIFPGGSIDSSFWDVDTSGLANMCGYPNCDDSFGKTTSEMQTATTFLKAGWDFIDETTNGTEDIWWINEGRDYPRLWWEVIDEN